VVLLREVGQAGATEQIDLYAFVFLKKKQYIWFSVEWVRGLRDQTDLQQNNYNLYLS
jgi:hypothetical protein